MRKVGKSLPVENLIRDVVVAIASITCFLACTFTVLAFHSACFGLGLGLGLRNLFIRARFFFI
nr:hypothetical protein Iba_scaffold96250CG0010 [Ipomoea batatas]GMD67237.1 hypothetical protein Iba_scaffold49775CG0010 [Ipomoea batatas]